MSLIIQRLDNRVHMIIRQKEDFIYMQMQKYCSCLQTQKRALENPRPPFIADAAVLALNFLKSTLYNAQLITSSACWQFHGKTDDQRVIMHKFRWMEELLMRLE